MSVYERAIEGKDLLVLVEKFTNRPEFEKGMEKVRLSRSISEKEYDEGKGFEVINDVDLEGEEGTIRELTLYLKYEDDVLVTLTELTIVKSDGNGVEERTFFTVDVEIMEEISNNQVLSKFSIDDGEFVFATTILNPNKERVHIPQYLEVPIDKDNDIGVRNSPVPCFNWDGSGTCCKFRYNANPFNPLVTYNWCGENCGGGCGNSPSTVNALDSCCKSHDCCYVNNKGYPARCSCDSNLISCARNTDNAGGSRVVTAMQAKRLWNNC